MRLIGRECKWCKPLSGPILICRRLDLKKGKADAKYSLRKKARLREFLLISFEGPGQGAKASGQEFS